VAQVGNTLVVVEVVLVIMDLDSLAQVVAVSSSLNIQHHNNFKGRNKWHILQK
jgi:hypothetical protein